MQNLKGSEKCVLSVKYFFHLQENESTLDYLCTSWRRPLLCCAATDGHVTIWDLGPLLLEYHNHPASDVHPNPNPPVRLQIHQSGINDMAVKEYSPCSSLSSSSSSSYLLASVGDDNALVITCFMVESRPQHDHSLAVSVVWQLVEHAAHSSSITGKIVKSTRR